MSSRRRSSSPHRNREYPTRRRSFSSDSSSDESIKIRGPRELPDLFGKKRDALKVSDERSVLQQMETAYAGSPLNTLNKYVEGGVKVKVWTRGHNNIRGILTGYIVVFDKHWNLIMRDCTDVFHKPKKSKTPFLRNIDPNEVLPDFPAKVLKLKKEVGDKTASPNSKAEETEVDPPNDGPKGGKKKRGKKKKTTIVKKTIKQIFVRGNNVIMISPDSKEKIGNSEEEK